MMKVLNNIYTNFIDAVDLDLSTIPEHEDIQIHIRGDQTGVKQFKELQKLMGTRRASGRYMLVEATEFICTYTSETLGVYTNGKFDEIEKKLIVAVQNDQLNTYAPNQNFIRDKKHGVNSFYEEVYWDDLNQWLTDNEKRISWRFVNPVCDKHEIQVNKPTKAHTIKNRTNILDAEINFAKKNALDKNDPSSVWAELIKNAENKDLKVKGCLIGIDEKSIKYLDGDEVKFFTKKNLSGRMNRK